MDVRLVVIASSAILMAAPADAGQASSSGIDVAAPSTVATNRAIAERAASLLEHRYVVPALGMRYATALRAKAARGDYAAYVDRRALADRLTADLQAVAPDRHLRFYPVEPARSGPSPTQAPAQTSQPDVVGIAPGIRSMRWVEPGVAYVSFEHFDDRPEAMAAMRRFLADYASARALVIDSRGNHGGAFDMMGLLANHLFARSLQLADMDHQATMFARPLESVTSKPIARTRSSWSCRRKMSSGSPSSPISSTSSASGGTLTSRHRSLGANLYSPGAAPAAHDRAAARATASSA